MFNIPEELKKLPDRPGVYLMHDAEDRIIYVGKAIVLKNRVRQYFQAGYKRSPKIEKMVSQIAWFEYIVTDSETEALVLECNLIKEHSPKYNTMLTDDKAYPYIRISVSEAFPRVTLARRLHRDGARYYGPYTTGTSVRDAIKMVQKLFCLRSCSRRLPEETGKERPCLNYHIGLCKAPCQGFISQEEYRRQIEAAEDFLKGNYGPVKKDVTARMQDAAERLDFESAASWREVLYTINHMEESQKISDTDQENRDIIAIARGEVNAPKKDDDQPEGTHEAGAPGVSTGEEGVFYEDAIAQVFFVREGKLIGRDHVHMRVAPGDSDAQILSDFIKQFYAGTPFLPRELFLETEPEEAELIGSWLTGKAGHKVSLIVPQRGDKHRLMQLAADNAKILLSKSKEEEKRKEARTIGAVRELGDILGIPGLRRIEAYDISNISGFQSVGSMVVFENGEPRKNAYRKFRIKSVEGPNDYASLYEVIYRRFAHGLEEMRLLGGPDLPVETQAGIAGLDDVRAADASENRRMNGFSAFPDVILMDGGKGQVHVAQEALAALGVDIPVCGMVKDDNHRTRGLYYNDVELPIDRHGELFHMITRIQDEAHRFAITFHRSLRGKDQVHSILDDIDGIGPARRKALMRTFPSLEQIKAATVDELSAIPEMNRPAARVVYAFFHDGEIVE
ncbi:MAG: excinuclease ABC subunit C [Lachnospiraceae bacterium]|nr:excinuclease ABC subunit C [Lachnospiraceae bacterium]